MINNFQRRDDEDAAAVIAVLAALAAAAGSQADPTVPLRQSLWGEPGHRLGVRAAPSHSTWWASGLPR